MKTVPCEQSEESTPFCLRYPMCAVNPASADEASADPSVPSVLPVYLFYIHYLFLCVLLRILILSKILKLPNEVTDLFVYCRIRSSEVAERVGVELIEGWLRRQRMTVV